MVPLPTEDASHREPPSLSRGFGQWTIIGIALGILIALVLLPWMLVPLVVLGLFGVACVRSALAYKRQGWVFGAAFGLFLILIGFGSIGMAFYTSVFDYIGP